MASRFRVDLDDEGKAEVSAPRPRKLRPLEDGENLEQPCATGQPAAMMSASKTASPTSSAISRAGTFDELEPPKRPVKSAMKKAVSHIQEDKSPPPKSALKSAMRKTASELPAATPQEPLVRKTKSALKASCRTPTAEELVSQPAPPTSPMSATPSYTRKKSALKSERARTAEPESSELSRVPKRSDAGRARARPSIFKMTCAIEDPARWSATALCKHYFHMAAQKMLWDQHVAATASAMTSRKSIRLSDLSAFSTQLHAGAAGADCAGSPGGGVTRMKSADRSFLRSQSVCIEDEEPMSTLPTDTGDHPNYEISPLKEFLLAKKPHVATLRKTLQDMDNTARAKWMNCTLDATPPPMPSPLFHAVAAAQWDVVDLLVELGVDVLAQYEGKSLLKGWIKPNTPLVDSIQSRKGRFVGTMLGDKLEAVEVLLRTAAKKQQPGPIGVEAETKDKSSCAYRRLRSKSVQLSSCRGLMLHTQGHPNSKYELDLSENGFVSTSTTAAIQIETGQGFAIKAGSKLADSGRKDPEAELWNEIVILRRLEDPNIIRLHETFEDETHIFMVFERCRGGDFFEHLLRNGSLPEKTVMRLACQMGSAIRHLHEEQICHRDIRPEAFMVSEYAELEESCVKLVDFNTAKEFGTSPLMTKICTLHYVAPEVLTCAEGYTEKVDVWSFGVLIFVMSAGVPPFDAEEELDVLQAVKAGSFSFEPECTWSEVSLGTKDLITQLMTLDPELRPSMAQVMAHPRLQQAETEGALIFSGPGVASVSSSDTNPSLQLRSALTQLLDKIDEQEVGELRRLFRAADVDQTGMVELSDCREALVEHLQGKERMHGVLELLQSDEVSGKIQYAMLLATFTDRRRQIRREAARLVFNTFDIDKNGNISVYEILQSLGKCSEFMHDGSHGNVPLRDLQAIWDEMRQVFGAQQMSDQELSFEEFFKALPRGNAGLDAVA